MTEIPPDTSLPRTFAEVISEEIREQAPTLAARWLDRLRSLIPVEPNEVFPSDSILDHVPLLIDHIAQCIAVPDHDIAANSFVVAKARELGELRHEQDASVHQLLREYELLRGILETFVIEQSLALHLTPDAAAVFACVKRLNQTLAVLTQTTVDTFVQRYSATIKQQQERLGQFNRMAGHELRQPLAALQAAVAVLQLEEGGIESRHNKALAVIRRNVGRLVELTATISRLSRMMTTDGNQPSMQRVSVTTVAREAARQLRDVAEARGVSIRVGSDLGEILVDVGQLELLLLNLLSNGIKYSDPSKNERFVAIDRDSANGVACVLRVTDNGIGMDAEQVANVFTPFYRGHTDRDRELGIEGLGLGLAIVRECATSLQGQVTVESTPGQGSTFVVTIPRES